MLLLLRRRNLRLPVSALLDTRLARYTRGRLAVRAVAGFRGLLCGSHSARRLIRRILLRCSLRLLDLLLRGCELFLQALDIIVRIVLNDGLWWLIGIARLVSRRLASSSAEGRSRNYQGCCRQIQQGLQILLNDAFWIAPQAPQFRLIGHNLRRTADGLRHTNYPFRVNSSRFLPSST